MLCTLYVQLAVYYFTLDIDPGSGSGETLQVPLTISRTKSEPI